MAQYEVMTTIFSTHQPVSKEKIIQNIDLHKFQSGLLSESVKNMGIS